MRHMKRFGAAVVLAGLSVSLLTGICDAKTITLTFAGRYTKAAHLKGWEFLDKAMTEYHKLHPDIKFEYVGEAGHEEFKAKLLVMAAGGRVPDILHLYQPWVFDFADRKLIDPLPADVSNRLRDKFFPVALASLTTKGRLYALPTENQVCSLLYNKKVLREAGIGITPQSWDELVALSMKLTEKTGNNVFKRQGFSADMATWATPALFKVLLYANGGKFMDKNELTFTGKAGLKAVEDLRDWFSVRQIATADTSKIIDGKTAFSIGYPWHILSLEPKFKNTLSQVIGVTNMPAGSTKRASYHYSWGYALASGSKHKKEALAFMEWLTTYAGAGDGLTYLGAALAGLGSLPSYKADTGKGRFGILKEWFDGYENNLDYAIPTDGLAYQEKMDQALYEELQPVISGKGSPSGALDNAKRTIQRVMTAKKR